MGRLAIGLLFGLLAASAQAQGYCNWCGCKGGPGYRIQESAGPRYARQFGKCVSHRDLARICGTPPTTHCAYEGNRDLPGASPPNPTPTETRRRGKSPELTPAQTE
jgi:hypothetical protein